MKVFGKADISNIIAHGNPFGPTCPAPSGTHANISDKGGGCVTRMLKTAISKVKR